MVFPSNEIAAARHRAESQASTRCGEQVRRSIRSLGEQAEPRRVDAQKHKLSGLMLQLGATSCSDSGVFRACCGVDAPSGALAQLALRMLSEQAEFARQ